MNTINNIWYLPSENTWKDFQIMAMKDTGTLTIDANGLSFKGSSTNIEIKDIVSLSIGKQGRDFVNNWVKIEYCSNNNELQRAYFADGNMRGWSGIFGGTKKIYNQLKATYNL
jgi:hypothetical protein